MSSAIPEDGYIVSPDPSDEGLELIGSTGSRYARFAMAALGSIPWVGGLLAASAAFHAEIEQGKVNMALKRWIEEHESKIHDLRTTLNDIAKRIDRLGPQAQERAQNENYLQLVRKAFRSWDRAETPEKREYVKRLITNAAATAVSKDDIVRLFLDWIDSYHEAHFAIMRAIYKNRGITRRGIWRLISGSTEIPRENSSEADLFRMLIHDLSTGRVIRQERATDSQGRFLKKSTRGATRQPSSRYMTSSFEDHERYELSELGVDFIHYVLHDAVSHIGSDTEQG